MSPENVNPRRRKMSHFQGVSFSHTDGRQKNKMFSQTIRKARFRFGGFKINKSNCVDKHLALSTRLLKTIIILNLRFKRK